MPKEKIDDLRRKKHELEAELEVIQHELDDSITRVRSDVSSKLDPMQFIRRHPWPIVGASALLGLLLSGNGRKKETEPKPKKKKKSVNKTDDQASPIFKPVLFSELKRMAARRLVMLASDYFDDILKSRRTGESVTIQNGEGSVKRD